MPRLAQRDLVEIDLDAVAGAARHLDDEEVRPAAPMSWMPTRASVRMSSRQASSSSFSVNGSPTCTVGRFGSLVLVELVGGHRRAVDAVAAGLGADVEDRVADAARRGRGRSGRRGRRRG